MRPTIQHFGIVCGEDNERVATFYGELFGMTEVNVTSNHRHRSAIYLSDGHICLACNVAPKYPVGRLHFGFQVANIEKTFAAAEKYGGRIGDRERPKDGRYAEAGVFDPIGTTVDVAEQGWRQRSQSEAATDAPAIQHIGIIAGEAVEQVATFYKEVFGMAEVHVTSNFAARSGIYLSDGHVNLACLMAPAEPVGRLHFGFKVQDIQSILEETNAKGGLVQPAKVQGRNRFAEAAIQDPVGTTVDVAVRGWRTEPGGPPYELS